MNERIKKLMGQTLDEKFSHTWTAMSHDDLEKFVAHFSELLIKDCADTAFRFDGVTVGQGYTIAKHLKQHFGVDE